MRGAAAAIVALTSFSFISTSCAETPHLQFVSTYIRQLQNLERLRTTALAELQDDSVASRMAGCIRNGTRFELELRSQISMLKSMQLNAPFDKLPPSLAEFNELKIELYKKMSAGCETLMSGMSGPKPGVDYDAIAAKAPKLTAELDYIDHAIFDATPLVFATLISPVPDKNNHISNLIITTAERKKLIDDLNSYFGAKLDQEQQPWLVSAATLLRDYLLKDYAPSDAQLRPNAQQTLKK